MPDKVTGFALKPPAVTQPPPLSPAETTSRLRLLGLASFGSVASMRVCDPMLVALGQEFHRSAGEASQVVSAFMMGYGVMQLLYGPLADRIGKLSVVGLAASGCAVVSLLVALAPTFELLVLCRALMGAVAAGVVPMSLAWVGDNVPYERRQETLARLMGATLSGTIAGQWLGGLAADTIGWRAAFWGLALIFGVAAFRLRRGPRDQPPATAQRGLRASLAAPLGLLRLPRVRWVLTAALAEGAVAYGILAFIPTRLVEHFGFTLSAAGTVMVLFGFGGLCYSQFARTWLRLLGEKGMSHSGATLLMLALLALAFGNNRVLAIVACAFAGLGLYMLHSTLQTQASQMAPAARGTGVALFASLLFFGQSIGVPLAAAGLDRGLGTGAFAAAALATLGLGLWIARGVGQPAEGA